MNFSLISAYFMWQIIEDCVYDSVREQKRVIMPMAYFGQAYIF